MPSGSSSHDRHFARRSGCPKWIVEQFKARLLLHALLAADADRARITAAFAVAGGDADPDTG
jgi:hypothetical protein